MVSKNTEDVQLTIQHEAFKMSDPIYTQDKNSFHCDTGFESNMLRET